MIAGLTNLQALLVGTGVVLLGTAGLVLYGLIQRAQKNEKERFEAEDIEEIITPEIDKMLFWASSSSLKLRYNWDTKGKIVKHLDNMSDIEIDKEEVDINIDEEQLEKDYKEGKISKRAYMTIKEHGQEPVHLVVLRDTGLFGKLSYIIDSIVSSEDIVGRIVVVPDRLIEEGVDYMSIKKQADIRGFAGMDVAVESSVFNFIESIAFKNLYKQALEDQQNYHKQVNFFASQFSQELQKLEKEANVEGQKYAGRNSDIFNED